jgi:acetoin utilization protein AcuC
VRSAFIHSEDFADFEAYEGYPWLFERSEATHRLCKRLKLFEPEWITVHSPEPASEEDILRFHKKEYVSILKKANKGTFDENWLKYGVGTTECPVYEGVYDYHALATGATLLGAELLAGHDADIVFSPTGGFHHAGPDFAAGFCYLNDIVMAIKERLGPRKRVLYIDIDAHHGDQVQEAFYRSKRVMFISFHESGKTLFPFKSGFEHEIGKGHGKGYNINVPLPENTSDDEFLWAFEKVVLPAARAFQPHFVVAILGADGLYCDPFSHLQLTNASVSRSLDMILQVSPKLLALGCGGYVLDNVARTWTLAWAVMNGLGPEEEDTALFGGMFWGDKLASLKDRPHFVPDDVKKSVRAEVERVVRSVEKNVFPILDIKT